MISGVNYTVDEAALESGATRNQVRYHCVKGAIPEPSEWGGRLFYTAAQVEELRRFFAGRRKWGRTTSIKVKEVV